MIIDNIGEALREIRIEKGLTAKEVALGITTPQRLSDFELEKSVPHIDVFLRLLSRLNASYEEFIHHLDNEYLHARTATRGEIAKYTNLRNLDKLDEISEKYDSLFQKYQDAFFLHARQISKATAVLLRENTNFSQAKKHLQPIRDYLSSVDIYGEYEVYLIGNCLYLFDVTEVEDFLRDALDVMSEESSIFLEQKLKSAFFTNLAIYFLDYPTYYIKAERYANEAIIQASLDNNATDTIHAHIVRQVARFKLENGTFDYNYLIQLINTFQLIEFHNEYQVCLNFITKHGIILPE